MNITKTLNQGSRILTFATQNLFMDKLSWRSIQQRLNNIPNYRYSDANDLVSSMGSLMAEYQREAKRVLEDDLCAELEKTEEIEAFVERIYKVLF